jgi:NAD(P)-dependent dehydrogenase (short-subunit alcohol dehydrogenase family)
MSRSVLVTGTSSGIGRATALHLAAEGWRVFAGVRKDADGRVLSAEASGELEPLKLDVTEPDSIGAAADRLREATGGRLDGLVNNAGIYVGAPLELMEPEEIERTFAVNVVGLLAVTRACLPLLRAASGRIVNVSSISGLVALPGVAAYAGSKHAVEAITDSLRVELKPFGIHVAAVEPGSIRTQIWEKGHQRDTQRKGRDDARLRKLYAPLVGLLEKLNAREGTLPPERVAEAIADALSAKRPRNRYLVGMDARSLSVLDKLPEGLRDRLIAARAWRD